MLYKNNRQAFLTKTLNMRQNPLVHLSMLSFIISGTAFTSLYPLTNFTGTPAAAGLKFGLLAGLILVPFISLDIPGRFSIPSEWKWILIQSVLGMIQSAAAGMLVGLIYGKEKSIQ